MLLACSLRIAAAARCIADDKLLSSPSTDAHFASAAVPEDIPHQEEIGQEGQAEQTHPTVDSIQDRQQDQVCIWSLSAVAISPPF